MKKASMKHTSILRLCVLLKKELLKQNNCDFVTANMEAK